MCPPPRRLALEANGCFMVQVPRGPYRIQGCGAIIAPQWRAPPGILNASIVARARSTPDDRIELGSDEGQCLSDKLDSGIPIQGFPLSGLP